MKGKYTEEEFLLATQLSNRGIPLDPEVLKDMQAACRGLSIFQTGTILENTAFDLYSGGAGFILSVAMCNESNRVLYLAEYRLELPWPEPQVRWLEDPQRKVPREDTYSFPKPGPEGFEREIVLNHRLGRRGGIFPGGSPDGLLLGVGEAPIPEKYQNRQRLQTQLLIFDTRGGRYELSVDLCVRREALRMCNQRRAKTEETTF